MFSTDNTTIEAFWLQHRHRSAQFWIDLFGNLQAHGHFDGGPVDKWCLWAVYMPLLQQDLRSVVDYHNNHRIRRQINRERPSGRPEDLYARPTNFGGARRGKIVHDVDMEQLLDLVQIDSLQVPDYLPRAVQSLVVEWMAVNNLTITLQNSVQLYLGLRNYFHQNL